MHFQQILFQLEAILVTISEKKAEQILPSNTHWDYFLCNFSHWKEHTLTKHLHSAITISIVMSKEIPDIYKLTPMISLDDQFSKLFTEVRNHRAKMTICPSAQPDINAATIINEFCDTEFYKDDYQTITNYFADDTVKYEDTIHQIRLLSKLDIIAHSKD